ncbi:glycosyltransferase family 2 protein, partial [Candidatus Woesearchaeota archaeon]|nr:glycosyltransferase family 2 protein [Candidatus Woesearchaeota archaeon]
MADPILSVMLWVVYLVSLYFAVFWLLVWLDKRDTLKAEDKAERKPSKLPMVSVIIPAYNEEETIAATVQSVLDLDYPHELLDIMVVNDGSKDNTQEEIDKVTVAHPNRLRIIRHETNKGKAASMNDGIAAAKGEYFACLDADSFVDRETLKKMVTVFEQGDETLAIVTPAMRTVAPKTFAQKLQCVEYMLFLFVARLMSHIDCLSVAPGPFSLYRTSIVKEIGGFEVGNPTEDMEIAFRMQSRHYRLKQCHDAHVYTVPPATFKELYHQRRYRWFRGGIVNTLKYRHMLLNKAYGDFGLIQMLINIVGYALAFST